jgi:hypothetical protein
MKPCIRELSELKSALEREIPRTVPTERKFPSKFTLEGVVVFLLLL